MELGQLSNHDEARRLLMELLHQDWFRNLESMHKSVAGIYTWFTLFCGAKERIHLLEEIMQMTERSSLRQE